MKTLDKAVIDLSGKYPSSAPESIFVFDYVCTRAEFEKRAKELGFVSGYRWGVEYQTNGERPELADDVMIIMELLHGECYIQGDVCVLNSQGFFGSDNSKFKITDSRYKPQDTSYLDEPAESATSSLDNGADWFDYEAQKALRLPPVDLICEAFDYERNEWLKVKTLKAEAKSKELACVTLESAGYYGRLFWGCKFRPSDCDRKAEAEKKRVVDAAITAYDKAREEKMVIDAFAELYDGGYLRMPPEKN